MLIKTLLGFALSICFVACVDARPRGAPNNVPQIACNLVTGTASVGGPCTSPAATCNGDVQTITTVVTTTSGSNNFSTSTNVFVPGDVGKVISLAGLSSAGIGGNYAVIATYNSATSVTLANNVLVNISSSKTFGLGSDDAGAFLAFNTWALANQGASNQVVLTVPNGSNCWFGSTKGTNFARGINNFILEGTGATLSSVSGIQFALGGNQGICNLPITNASGCSARIQTVLAGATQVQLTSASLASGYISRFSAVSGAANNWILITGLNPQAIVGSGSGQPPNLTFLEWRRITAINVGTGVIDLDRPLSGSYLSTWPLYQDGSVTGDGDQGGPATIYAVDQYWNATAEYRGFVLDQGSNQTYAKIRTVTYRGVTVSGGFGAIPTQNETWSAINSSFPNVIMETDKLVGDMVLDGTTVQRIDFQSSSTQQLTINNSTIDTIFGSGNTTVITDSTIATLRPGAFAYGASIGPFTCTRCKITTDFRFNGGVVQNLSPSVTSMSSGVISFLNSDVTGGKGPPSRVYVPGGNVFFTTPGVASMAIFNVQALTQDATNTYIQTNQAGGFPDTTSLGAGAINYWTHPAPQFTCTDPDAASVNDFKGACVDAGATAGAPLGQFAKRTFTPTVQTNNLGDMHAWGKLVRLTIDVTVASTHTAGNIGLRPTGQSHLNTIKQSDWTFYDWVPYIEAKTFGKRVITPSGITCDTGSGPVPGGCSGDGCILPASGCFALPEAVWIQSVISPGIFGTFTGGVNPTFTITIETDQGVVP